MNNFTYHNPVRIIFGKGTIGKLSELVDRDVKVLMTYGGGSIKKNGVYEQVKAALRNHQLFEFGGIEANPQYVTLMKAVTMMKKESIDFILAVGGGSVIDGTKFIAAAVHHTGPEPWDLLTRRAHVKKAVPFGLVLTLAATGSEMNGFAVISRAETQEKLSFGSPRLYPRFSILDPETTFSLSPRQTANGIIDAFVHVCEQYLTYPAEAALQDRQAESILMTLIDIGPRLMAEPASYEYRADLMWAATQALNGLIGCGVPQDWASHAIGHELTALYGLDHGQSLAVVLPALLRHQRKSKWLKLLQYGERVWDLRGGSEEERIEATIGKTEEFFRSLGAGTRLSEYSIRDGLERVGAKIAGRSELLGEHHDIGAREIDAILALAR